jgi:hypothetical protein
VKLSGNDLTQQSLTSLKFCFQIHLFVGALVFWAQGDLIGGFSAHKAIVVFWAVFRKIQK